MIHSLCSEISAVSKTLRVKKKFTLGLCLAMVFSYQFYTKINTGPSKEDYVKFNFNGIVASADRKIFKILLSQGHVLLLFSFTPSHPKKKRGNTTPKNHKLHKAKFVVLRWVKGQSYWCLLTLSFLAILRSSELLGEKNQSRHNKLTYESSRLGLMSGNLIT